VPGTSLQLLDSNIPELYAAAMAKKANMALFPLESRVRPTIHGLADLAYIGIDNNAAIKLHSDHPCLGHDFLRIPVPHRFQTASSCRNHTINGAVILIRL